MVYARVVPACVLSRSVLSDSATPWTVARQAPLSVGFPRRAYRSGLPFSLPHGTFPVQGLNPWLLPRLCIEATF